MNYKYIIESVKEKITEVHQVNGEVFVNNKSICVYTFPKVAIEVVKKIKYVEGIK